MPAIDHTPRVCGPCFRSNEGDKGCDANKTLHRVTKILGVYDCLRTVLGRERVRKPKPAPDIYLAAAEALGAAPER